MSQILEHPSIGEYRNIAGVKGLNSFPLLHLPSINVVTLLQTR